MVILEVDGRASMWGRYLRSDVAAAVVVAVTILRTWGVQVYGRGCIASTVVW